MNQEDNNYQLIQPKSEEESNNSNQVSPEAIPSKNIKIEVMMNLILALVLVKRVSICFLSMA